ncbi:MAG: FecR family protein [Tannerellaceae bacterium]|jgi:ferric-dicitrate binding protein FerR (iron transport regulator)|nr:FecR family protein [Tannerellaceae bacterium]
MNRDILHKFCIGQASYEEKEAIKQWLEADPGHMDELIAERALLDLILLADKPDYAMNMKEPARRRSAFLRFGAEALKIAAVAALALAGGIYFHTKKMNDMALAIHTVSVPAGQRVNILLPDSTSVWLNARSEIKYPSAFLPDRKRVVELNGEAYFEVKHKGDAPFVVHTGKCDVEVHGTTFNLDAYSNSDNFSIALIEGSVKVTSNENPENTIILSPRRKADYINSVFLASSISADDYDTYRWRDGLLCFKDISFTELLSRLEKCYDVRIVTENINPVTNYAINGKLRISDGIDNALRVLQKEAGYTFIRDSETNVIYIRW